MKNTRIREYASSKHVFLWEIAMKLGINDGNFSRKLRRQFSDDDTQKIIACIDEIAAEKEKEV
jgi:hypothetical protein